MLRFLLSCFLLIFVLSPFQGKCMDEEPNDTGKEKISIKKKKKAVVEPRIMSMVADESDVVLIPGGGTKASGGGPGGHYWNIFHQGMKAGKVFINFINEEPLGEHASLQIFLNKASQGKHIGRYAYIKACEQSQYDKVFAYMSKKNVASIRAAAAAGFVEILTNATRQVVMEWTRKKKE